MYNDFMSLTVERIGMVARWRPVHRGHVPVLNALCMHATHARFGIGSSNEYNARNPFTLAETTDMLKLALAGQGNYELLPVPDLHDGPRWRLMVMEMFGALDIFVTDNPYVARLLADDYRIMRPVDLVPPNERIPIDGTLVRKAMARGDAWKELVPDSITDYIVTRHIDERFRREFGLETLAMETIVS